MDFYVIKATDRETRGKSPAKVMRREGLVPAVVYGQGSEPRAITVSAKDLVLAEKASKTIQIFATIQFENGDTKHVMIKEHQKDPLTGESIHVDFYEVSENKQIIARVPVVTAGKCIGVEYGGILQVIRRTLDVKCYPQDVPESILIDITELKMGDSIHVEEIEMRGNKTIIHDVNFTVITIVPPKGLSLGEDAGTDEESEEEEA